MRRAIQLLLWWATRRVMHLRYRVEVRGLEKLRDLAGPVLVLPNHAAYIDPPLVLSHIRLPGPLRPAVTEYIYRRAWLYPFMRLIDALEVRELEEHSHQARQQTLAMIDAIVAGLARGESFLLYPAGQVKHQAEERIGAARAASEIVQRSPDATLLLVRIGGLWGSMFSYAPTGKPPNLPRTLLRGLGWLLAGLVFLVPKRRVTITLEVLDRSKLPGLSREQFNRFLEDWYNREGPEPPVFVPYHRLFGPRELAFPERTAVEAVELEKIRPATIRAVHEILEEHLGRPLSDEEKRPETPLDEIGLDSIGRMDVALKIEERFGFRSDRVATTVGELWALAEGRLNGTVQGAAPAPAGWNRRPSGPRSVEMLGQTIPEAFLRRALLHPDDVAIADRTSGVLTYRRLLVGAHLLSKRLAQLPNKAIGVLLPASAAADVVFLALHLAGKLPVMLNWTTGPVNLAHAVRKLEVRSVLTSRRVIDRLGIRIEGAEYVFLEDIRSRIRRREGLAALVRTYLRPQSFLKDLPSPNPDEPAVVLFTSGSESLPKAVPLTHRNLIVNLGAGLPNVKATRDDTILAFLPPFHSFGVLACMLAPLLGGIRAVYHPDPTDARGLVRLVRQYQASLMFTTPTFLGHLFSAAEPDDLRSLRVIVTGAEKCPPSIFERGRQLAPGAVILEGYGITECSPIVSVNRLGQAKEGTVGPPLDNIEVRVVDPETRRPLPPGATGVLLVSGPSVFPGYIQHEGPGPFVELEGRRWYNTGDLVQLDPEGFLHFQGRLKRFLKAGGEMISLPALEEPLAALHPPTEEGPRVAVEGIETHSGRWIVLFTTEPISLREANGKLAEAGFRGVMRLDEVVQVPSIPVLGTGKTDYKQLRSLVTERVQAAEGAA